MDLQRIRQNIDRIDAEILQLLTRRMEFAIRTKRFKSEITDTSREEAVIAKAKDRAKGLLGGEFGEELFKVIMTEGRRLQTLNLPLIAFQGEHGSYSEAAITKYDPTWIGIPSRELPEIFESIVSGAVDFGIVPIENSAEGSVSETQDLLIDSNLHIVGEIRTVVHHSLLTLKETDYRDIKDVYSTPRALSQCRGFLKRNKLEGRPYYDTAGAAIMLLRDRPTAAAVIGSAMCAKLYDLEILKDDIEDSATTTRYLILAREALKSGGNKCSVVFRTPHKAGALIEVLKIFSDAGINLASIESRPLRSEPDQVAFLLELAGSMTDPKVARAIEQLGKHTTNYRVLGSYEERVVQ